MLKTHTCGLKLIYVFTILRGAILVHIPHNELTVPRTGEDLIAESLPGQ